MLLDWSDNGRIDRVYALSCYEDAVAGLPQDLRDYTDAAEVIERALQTAVRGEAVPAPPTADTSAASSLPTPLLVLVGASIVLLAVGGLDLLARRASGRPGPHR